MKNMAINEEKTITIN